MDIIKAFSNNEQEYHITIKGTEKHPLFRANDIGEVLGIKNIRSAIQYFEKTEKVVVSADTFGGNQMVSFLTTLGLYKLLTMSKKPIAKIFQKWMFNVIEEIRINGEYKLNKEIQELKNELEIKNDIIEKQIDNHTLNNLILREKTILEQYKNNIQCVYYGQISNVSETGEKLVKFGKSNNLPERTISHKKTYNNFYLVNGFKVVNETQIERAIKTHPLLVKQIRKIKTDNNHTELLAINEELTFEKLDKIINDIIMSFEYTPENYTKILYENEKLNKIIDKLATKQVGLENIDITPAELQITQLLEKNNILVINNEELKNDKRILEATLEKQYKEYLKLQEIITYKSEECMKENINLREELILLKNKYEANSSIVPVIQSTEIIINPDRKIKKVPKQSDIYKLEKINKNNEVVFIYDNLCHCLNVNEANGYNSHSILYAARMKTERYGFLWRFVDETKEVIKVINNEKKEDEETIQDVEENDGIEEENCKTKTKKIRQGYVAKLSGDKKIINVYCNTAMACSLNGFNKNISPPNSTNYYYHFYDLPKEDQDDFLKRCGGIMPTLFTGGNGVGVFNDKNILLKVYSTSANLRVKERLSQHCVETYLNSSKMFENRFLKSVPDRPACFE